MSFLLRLLKIEQKCTIASFVLKLVTIVSTNYKFLIQGVLCKKKGFRIG